MGNEISTITPGLHISNALPAKSLPKLQSHNITHIVAILPKAKPRFDSIKYFCVQNLKDKNEAKEDLRKLLPEES